MLFERLDSFNTYLPRTHALLDRGYKIRVGFTVLVVLLPPLSCLLMHETGHYQAAGADQVVSEGVPLFLFLPFLFFLTTLTVVASTVGGGL